MSEDKGINIEAVVSTLQKNYLRLIDMEAHCSVDFVKVLFLEKQKKNVKVTSVENISLVATSTTDDDKKNFLNLVYLTSNKMSESLHFRYQLFTNHTVCIRSGIKSLILLDTNLNTAFVVELPTINCRTYVISFLVEIAKILVLKDELESTNPDNESVAEFGNISKQLLDVAVIVTEKVKVTVKKMRERASSEIDSYLLGVKKCESDSTVLPEKAREFINEFSAGRAMANSGKLMMVAAATKMLSHAG